MFIILSHTLVSEAGAQIQQAKGISQDCPNGPGAGHSGRGGYGALDPDARLAGGCPCFVLTPCLGHACVALTGSGARGGGPRGCPGTLHHGRHRRAPWNIQHEKPEWLIRVIRGAHSRPPSTGASCSLLTPAALWGPCELPEKMAPLPRWRSCRVRSSPVDTDSEASTKVTKIWSVRPYG